MSKLTNRLGQHLTNLETRLTPAVSVRFLGGNLTVTGDNTANDLEIKMISANSAKVENNGTFVGTYSLTGNLTVRLGNNSDSLTINLNGENIPGNVTVNSTGNGGDTVTIKNSAGTNDAILGRLTVNLGNGADSVNIGSTGKVDVGGGVFLNGGSGLNTAKIGDDAADDYAGQTVLTRFAEAKLGGDFGTVVVNNGSHNFDSKVTVNGDLAGSLTVTGGFQDDELELSADAASVINGHVVFIAGEGENTLVLGTDAKLATVNGNLTYTGGNGGNTFESAKTDVFGSTSLVFGNGDNTYDFGAAAAQDYSGAFSITAGNGEDEVELTAKVSVSGLITLNLGNGANTFFTNSATLNGASVTYTGGSGADEIDIDDTYTFALFAYLGAGADTFSYSDPASAVGSDYIDFGVDFDTDDYNQDAGVVVTWNQTLLNLP